MAPARDRAMFLRTIYQVEGVASDEHLDAMLADRSITVITSREMPVPYEELLHQKTLALRAGLGRPRERWNKAHALGHIALHVGNQWEMPQPFVDLQETQADDFAGWLVFGDLSDLYVGFPITGRYLAEAGKVPLECVEKWWRAAGGSVMRQPRYELARDFHWARSARSQP
jgi:hypothetical protein